MESGVAMTVGAKGAGVGAAEASAATATVAAGVEAAGLTLGLAGEGDGALLATFLPATFFRAPGGVTLSATTEVTVVRTSSRLPWSMAKALAWPMLLGVREWSRWL